MSEMLTKALIVLALGFALIWPAVCAAVTGAETFPMRRKRK